MEPQSRPNDDQTQYLAQYWNGPEANHWLVHENRYERMGASFTRVQDQAGEGGAHALLAVFVHQPVVGFRAVPVLGQVLGLAVVGSALWFHDSHPTPSSILEVNMGDQHG